MRRVLQHDPAVAAARLRLEAASAAVRGARASFPILVEAAPGVGFTNGNSLLSHRLDIGGRRKAATREATGERAAAESELVLARLRAASDARIAYFDLVRAQAAAAAAGETATLARQLRDAVRRRVELGEAPAVQGTRADIEVARAEQEVIRASGDVRAGRAALNLLLGRDAGGPVSLTGTLALAPLPLSVAELMAQAERTRPDLAAAHARIEARRGVLDVAHAARRPDLSAEVATDFWSLDRSSNGNRFGSDTIGLQARLSFPLGGDGALRAGVERARAEVAAAEAARDALRRAVRVEVERLAAELAAAREVALNYEQSVLPRTRELVQATRAGYESGLSSFVEVLEAQRVARQTYAEYQAALFSAVRTGIALDQAIGVVPGLAASSP